jgi:hypothetical protein
VSGSSFLGPPPPLACCGLRYTTRLNLDSPQGRERDKPGKTTTQTSRYAQEDIRLRTHAGASRYQQEANLFDFVNSETIQRILLECRTIAVVGLSSKGASTQGTTESESADYALLSGNVRKKRLPSPGRLSTQMVPC